VDGRARPRVATQPVTVQDLDLVAALEVDAAVTPRLPDGTGLVRAAELDVQEEGPGEGLARHDVRATDFEDGAVEDAPRRRRLAVPLDPAVQALAVEQRD